MPYPLPLTRTEAYLAYKAGVIQQSDLKPSLAVPRNGIDAWLAYWTGLAEDYPKREDGTPHILQEEEAYIAYLCGVITEYPEKCLRRVGAYLRYLISARWGRPDHPLNREELYLSLIKTQVVPSGDPSSDIVINGTAKAPFQDVKMYGDTYQQTYTGKNLLQFIPQSSEGMTTTYDTATGLVHVSGTNSSSDGKWSNISQNVDCSIPAGTYTLSVTEAQSNLDFHIRLRYTDDSTGDFYVTKNNTSKTFEMPKDAKKVYIWYGGLTPTYSSVDFTVGIQLEAGSTPTSFEPYVGGQPSPNPDYPQPIQTVTGRQVVNVTGKNLYRSESKTTAWDGATITTDGSEITFTGNAGGNSSMSYTRQEIPISIPSGTTLTVSAKTVSRKAWESGAFRCGVRLKYSDGTNYNLNIPDYYPGNFGTTKSKTITTDKDVIGVAPAGFSYNAKGIIDPVTFVFQLEKGSTVTAYEPYSSNDYEINLGKNLFDKSSSNILAGYIPGSTIVTQEINRLVWIKCEPNTAYTLSTRAESWTREVYTTDIVPAVGVAATRLGQIESGENSTTVQTGATAQYLVVRIWQQYLSGTPLEEELGYLQIELGSQATTYAPYFEPIELCKLDTYQDYIWKDGEDWKVHKAISTITVDGSEGWAYNGDNKFNAANISGMAMPINADALCYCATHIGVLSAQNGAEFAPLVADIPYATDVHKTLKTVRIKDIRFTEAQALKTWLSQNNTTIYYVVATATDTTITDQTLIAQLDALLNGGAEDGTTYIKVSATDPNLPGLLYVEAPKYE